MFKYLSRDVPAGLVVFLVALPLCLGIALASGAPPMSGVIAGIVGGVIVSVFSGSELSVSGPAAGLAVIVADAIHRFTPDGTDIKSGLAIFAVALVIAGVLQFLMGVLKWGMVADFIPNSVIKGMLAAIGIVIFLKQIPHALGRDNDWEGDFHFFQYMDGENTFTEIVRAIITLSPGAVIITLLSLGVLAIWKLPSVKKIKWLYSIPAPLVVVIVGILINELYQLYFPVLYLGAEPSHMVQIDILSGDQSLTDLLIFPDFKVLGTEIWVEVLVVALTVAIVASLETLLCIEAADKLDPEKRISDTNQELKAQGIGNVVSGLMGGLPITSVIVRTSANVYAGAKSRMSAFVHGLLLIATILAIPELLNKIPLACLAAILLQIGYKLASPQVMRSILAQGPNQYIPFFSTVVAIVFTDLLVGILIGIVVGLVYVIRSNFHSPIELDAQGNEYRIVFKKDISFLNKSALKSLLKRIPDEAVLTIDGSGAQFIDQDIYDIIDDFRDNAAVHRVSVKLVNMAKQELRLIGSSARP